MNENLLKQNKDSIRDVNALNNYFKAVGQQLYHKEIVNRLEKEGFTVESNDLDDLILVDKVVPVFLPSLFADSIYIYHPTDWEKKDKWATEYTDWQLSIMERAEQFKDPMFEDLTTEKFKTVEALAQEIKEFFDRHPLITKKLVNMHKTGIFEHLKSFKSF